MHMPVGFDLNPTEKAIVSGMRVLVRSEHEFSSDPVQFFAAHFLALI